MRAILSCCAISLAMSASANSYISYIGKLGKITEDLIERGLTPAHITIEYSLTDDCNLAGLRVTENSHPNALGTEVVDEVVSVMIGPFSGVADELIKLPLDGESAPEKLSMTTRMIGWSTEDGHRYVVCRFYSDGELESARLTDGHAPHYEKKIGDRIVNQALSELQTKTIRASFVSGDE